MILEVNNLVKRYIKTDFELNIKNLEIEQGSIIGLVGPNGSGKTTLIKLLVNLLYADEGQIILNGQPINEKVIINNVSYMPSLKNLYENMTVKHMLSFARSIPLWNEKKAKYLLDIFPLKLNKKVSTLSYGEKTQLYTIITFSKNVPLIILDEPTNGLDPVMQERMLKLIKEESSENKTILFSSHQLNEVEETADTIAVIKNGKIILQGFIDDLKQDIALIISDNVIDTQSLDIISKRITDKHNIYLVQKSTSSETRLNQFPLLSANLKDIFLNIIEGEVEK